MIGECFLSLTIIKEIHSLVLLIASLAEESNGINRYCLFRRVDCLQEVGDGGGPCAERVRTSFGI